MAFYQREDEYHVFRGKLTAYVHTVLEQQLSSFIHKNCSTFPLNRPCTTATDKYDILHYSFLINQFNSLIANHI